MVNTSTRSWLLGENKDLGGPEMAGPQTGGTCADAGPGATVQIAVSRISDGKPNGGGGGTNDAVPEKG